MDADTEGRQVASCKNGDKVADAGLVHAHAGRVFAICFGMLGNRCDAEDMAQQALLQGFTQIRNLRDARRFGPWIARAPAGRARLKRQGVGIVANNVAMQPGRTASARWYPEATWNRQPEGHIPFDLGLAFDDSIFDVASLH